VIIDKVAALAVV
jgi:hypothetical protein